VQNVGVEILFISMNYRLKKPEDIGGGGLKPVQRAVTVLSEIRTACFLSTSIPNIVDIHRLASFSRGHWTARYSKFSTCCVYRISSPTYYS
jgi:hypothetical protein